MRTVQYAVETLCQILTNADEEQVKEMHRTFDSLRDLSQATLRQFDQVRVNEKATQRCTKAVAKASAPLSELVSGK